MKRRALMALPLALFAASSAWAQNPNARDERGRPDARRGRDDPHVPYGRDGREVHIDRGNRGDRDNRGERRDRDERQWREERDRAWVREARRSRYNGSHSPPRYARGAGPYRHYHPGDRLPDEYRLRHYVVNDWHGHGLYAPPRGYHWVQTGGDFVLVAITTGIILQLLLRD